MRRHRRLEAGFALVELAVALAILGIVAGGVTALVAWAAGQQVKQEAEQRAHESAHQALELLARLLRTAGARGRPALAQGAPERAILCGLPWSGRTIRASVGQDVRGALALSPVSGLPVAAVCAGEDLGGPVDLVPGSRFAEVRFIYRTPDGRFEGCSTAGSPPCSAVLGVELRVRPLGSSWDLKSFVALRNAGGP